ncbi:MAG TPA: hypothetical protein VM686_21735 [Polyangiaceae bacterium]|jgi:hypothetical protein|nr:hypothetical protein [Polyangiaceae bacterium]
MLLLILYSFACVQVIRLSMRAMVRPGEVAGVVGIVANVVGLAVGGWTRGAVAIPVLVLAGWAAARAFRLVDDLPRDTDEERNASRAGMALVGMAVAEALIGLVVGLVWAIDEAG